MARPKKQPGYYDKARKLWCVDVPIGKKLDGTRDVRRVYAATQDGLEPKVRALRSKVDAGLPLGNQTMTVQSWCEHYIETIAPTLSKDAAKAARTTKWRDDILKTYVYPILGTKRLNGPHALSPGDVRSWMAQLAKTDARPKKGGVVTKLSPTTIAAARTVLGGALTAAMNDEVIVRNVVRLTKPPAGAKLPRVGVALEEDEVEAVFATSAAGLPTYHVGTNKPDGGTRPDRNYALAVVGLTLGCREAELLDLRWSTGVDLRAGTMRVVDAKTESGKRTIPLPQFVLDALREHKAAQRVERVAAPAWLDPDLVFPSTVGTRMDARRCLDWWHKLTERAGVGRRPFHAARHSAATIMLNRGVPLEQVSAILGHSSLSITSDFYAKPNIESLRGAVDIIDTIYGNA